ncbi:DUF4105 domain-containing protein [Thermomonas sp.]|uniref:lipoprotein N-acyltransferase Lnb domain-containing protein n=1 Tax=Thermomonas sp. TaxID=1971895 RepID=UPI002637161E|nr:DUF4105 domain-containing protein [Thermomonas sp.]MCO5054562.1 DUF4105 domain-containing protein [Thermomonas sp.]
MPSSERRRGGSDSTARRLLCILLPLLLLALGALRLAVAAVPASAPVSAPEPAAPAAAEPPRIGVLTMGPGDIFWERFGHDSIVVADPTLVEPTSYNFGFFDLHEAGFMRRFIEGRMQYMLVALPLSEDLDYYRRVGRGVRVQWLDLSPAQARALAAALAENARPENARYHYDYFTSNCTTKVRDALDRALDGRLRRQTENRSSGDSYRSESLRLAAPAPWLWVGFDIALGPSNDRALTRWQQDFLPRRLADDLRQIRLDDGRPLVTQEVELLPQRLAAEPEDGSVPLWPWLLAGIALALLIGNAGTRSTRPLAALAAGFWLLCGVLGLTLALAWGFTEHRALWANRNLLLLDPLCLLLLPGALALLRGRQPSARFRFLLLAVAVLAALACLPLWLQVFPQRNGHWIALLLPLHAALAWRWGRSTAAAT